MKRIRGFKLKRRISTLFRCIIGKSRGSRYNRIDPPERKPRSVTRFFSCIKRKAKAICCVGAGRGYIPLDAGKPDPVPKGRMAVYVGQSDGDFHRFLVPVIYFNHPLFGELLREAEDEFGFDHPGGITIPCQISEFESVQAKIAAGRGSRRLPTRKVDGW